MPKMNLEWAYRIPVSRTLLLLLFSSLPLFSSLQVPQRGFHVNLFAVPSQPSELKPTSVSATAIAIGWTRPSHQGENIINYEIYWNTKQEQEVNDVSTTILFRIIWVLYLVVD